MHAFATDQRTNNGDMPKFMQMLTDSERDAIARYLSDL
jgi:mono/diheme cytochrome c family protein